MSLAHWRLDVVTVSSPYPSAGIFHQIISINYDMSTTTNSKTIQATAEKLYHAFTDAKALEAWQAPGEMIGKVQHFDLRVGGGYEMSLHYPATDKNATGKTTDKEDRYTARFLELVPDKKIVQATTFETDDSAFKGEMIMEVTLEEHGPQTTVTITFKNLPPGISSEDNEKGTQMSLEKLAEYVA